ncbi:EamA family transporter [Curtobacterium sp. Csp1]|uniref:DMT family transporter n=1 Tax=unclassified Curtobacterium TaxID=257496 RepID=UPI001598C60F|nr:MULTISPECIES: EamA family transporter [unclassified Curtobacterium]QKS13579.1 EamA family transporter [Curtobacterium sp. csp3]QKS20620.1 EamA family transporter [Curtobacterium sp. Csp1]
MEDNKRWLLVAAVAPILWGSTYFVTKTFLPPGALWGGTLRALPAGLLLLVLVRRIPRGSWWWKVVVLGVLNVGGFFALVYQAAQLLPSSIASTVMATAPIALAVLAWLLLGERPSGWHLAGASVGIGGVALLLLGGSGLVDGAGVVVSVAAMASSSLGFVLGKKWNPEVGVLPSTAWQLVVGGVLLLTVAFLVEGPPPRLDPVALTATVWLTVVATALAYVAWFAALDHLRGDVIGLVGLLNPVAGVLLGVLVGGETIGSRQLIGLTLVLIGIAGPLLIHRRSTTATGRSARPHP